MKACNSCGKCCIKYSNGGLSASQSDIDLWESLRPDISTYVHDGKIWMDPNTGKQIELCPWLRAEPIHGAAKPVYTCAIYFDRPEDCRVYPANVDEMLNDDCEMLEPRDLLDLKKAQQEFELKYKDN